MLQINPAQKVSGKSWAETFWDACEASGSTADGYAYGDGHLQYVSSWKAPLQDTNRYGTSGMRMVILNIVYHMITIQKNQNTLHIVASMLKHILVIVVTMLNSFHLVKTGCKIYINLKLKNHLFGGGFFVEI